MLVSNNLRHHAFDDNDASLALKSNKIDASVGKTHISTYQPAAAPVAPVNGGDKATLTMASSVQVITVQSSFTDFFSSNYNRIQTPLNWQRVISGGVLLGVGVLLCLFGFRYLRFSLLLTGFIGGGIAAFAILTNTEPDGLWSNRILIYVAVCIAAGLLIGVLMLGLNKCAAWILGGAGGGYMFTLGLDMFLRTGFLENYKYLFRTGNNVPYQMYSGIYGMLGILSLTFLLGYLFQIPLYFLHKRKQRAHIPPAEPYGVSNRDSQYGGQWGSQYGSRDHLGAPQNQGALAEYTWWGKRKTKETPMNNPYNHGYSEKGYQPVYSQNNLNQPIHGENNLSHPTHDTPVATSSSTHVQASQAALVGGTASTTTEKPVVFEEKNWLGRTKVVPKLAENSTSTTTTTTTTEPNH
ncbi:hypothetical protein BGX29_009644 [Mortierella sp. GBA35]|nr:hypothetical protein BGX29_009644 [Mortierella sp. GBA35]